MHVRGILVGIAIGLLLVSQCLGLHPTSCRTLPEGAGNALDCDPNEIMTFTCGAGHGGHNDCAENIATEIECCKVTEGTLTSTDCENLRGDAGDMLSCAPKGMFLQGVCGSFNDTSCSGSSHSVRCCKYFLDETITSTPNRRMYPVEVGIEPSTNGYDSRCSSGKIAVGR
ncbi:unnamed protein product, partial [Darwinula stevensoni]